MSVLAALLVAWATALPALAQESEESDPFYNLGEAIGGPFCLLVLGAVGVWFFLRRSKKQG